jgi:hypothetical protein
MMAYDLMYNKMAAARETGGVSGPQKIKQPFDPARQVSPIIAHELNNILTIVQGYAERLLLRHNDDPVLTPHLKLIAEASKRAAAVVREATPPDANDMFRKPQNSRPAEAAA